MLLGPREQPSDSPVPSFWFSLCSLTLRLPFSFLVVVTLRDLQPTAPSLKRRTLGARSLACGVRRDVRSAQYRHYPTPQLFADLSLMCMTISPLDPLACLPGLSNIHVQNTLQTPPPPREHPQIVSPVVTPHCQVLRPQFFELSMASFLLSYSASNPMGKPTDSAFKTTSDTSYLHCAHHLEDSAHAPQASWSDSVSPTVC